jgi:hypothetical protein
MLVAWACRPYSRVCELESGPLTSGVRDISRRRSRTRWLRYGPLNLILHSFLASFISRTPVLARDFVLPGSPSALSRGIHAPVLRNGGYQTSLLSVRWWWSRVRLLITVSSSKLDNLCSPAVPNKHACYHGGDDQNSDADAYAYACGNSGI